MEHSPPPFFHRGPAPLVRLAFFASLSFALLVLDARFRYAETLRAALAAAAWPLQAAATAPVQFAERVAGYFTSQSQLRDENAELKAKLLSQAQDSQRLAAAAAEAAQLRNLVGASERLEYRTTPAEILYSGRDPYSRKVIVDKGTQHGVVSGQPVVDDAGVLGQVTRAHPLVSEVTLLTDKDQAIPVQLVRNGLRAVAFGAGVSGLLELRFMASNAEIQNGDKLVTSGIDGTYPPGLPVATVVRIERDSSHAFARIVCEPAAGVDKHRFVLVLANEIRQSPYPESGEMPPGKRTGKTRKTRRKEAGG
jgi:rod shape-determining protein MreC